MSKAGTCAIAVMAKAPRSGSVKTRLVPPLSFDEARALSAAFLRDTTENISSASRHAPIEGFVAYAPAGAEAAFEGALEPSTSLLLADGNVPTPPRVKGFGRCLLHAADTLLARGYGAACVLNSDSPTLPTSLLARAAQMLLMPGDRAVLGPAADGGYYLLGVKAAHGHLFEDVDWSTERVADQTRARAAELGLETVELAPWYDVDDRASLARLMAELSAANAIATANGMTPYAAPVTAQCLRGFGLDARILASVHEPAPDAQGAYRLAREAAR
ncbi:MAG TPA: TIGR04282 family arsenosugar biosynthesis glycosyltransferase [Alphaproteobacteria bacterium]|nr:TIGR04282 family arsenosugar biosynthesis glycosyltransferase [Alphaproteobacteria bacterium]